MRRTILTLLAIVSLVLALSPNATACNASYDYCLDESNEQREACFDAAETEHDSCTAGCYGNPMCYPNGFCGTVCIANCGAQWQSKKNQCEWSHADRECACNLTHCSGGNGDICF